MKIEAKNLKNWFYAIKNTDLFFIQLTLALSVIGLIFAFSTSAFESYRLTNNFWTLGFKQLAAFFIGLIALYFISKTNYLFWYRITWPLAICMLVLMLVTVFSGIGKASGGSQRWISIGFFQFQPAEIAKFSVLLLISKFLTKYKWFEFKKYYYVLFSFLLILIVLKQPDLGSAGILVLLLMEMFFVFGFPIWLLLPSVVIGLFIVAKNMLKSYQLDRITYWLNPYLEPQGRGYNLIQAKYAIGLGGLFGTGLGNSIQKQGNLPIPHADFIFSIISEEIGFLGVTAILVLYVTWVLRGIYIVNKVQNRYGRVLGTGILFLIGTQAAINILVATGLLPVTGVTLPFFSCGGTSLILTLSMCGILLNIFSSMEPEKIV